MFIRRALAVAPRALLLSRNLSSVRFAARAFSTQTNIIPDNASQATGSELVEVERGEWYANENQMATSKGTQDAPHIIFTSHEERIVGCEDGSSGHIWYKLKVNEAASPCPVCGTWVKLEKFPESMLGASAH